MRQHLTMNCNPWVGMPSTRFQGSKKKLLPDLHSVFSNLKFSTCLDAFGGTGSVSFLLKQMGKAVTYNDILPSNQVMAKALFSHKPVGLNADKLQELFKVQKGKKYKTIIQDYYENIYFTDSENQQIDLFIQNVQLLKSADLRSEAHYLLFQALLSKRPYNLFHRANLNMRLSDVKRSFGNKATWDKPIFDHCLKFLKELQLCRSCTGKFPMQYNNISAFEIKSDFDLVYIDTPYAKSEGTQESNYFNFYHFLDALLAYDNIEQTIHGDVKHRPFYEVNKSWYPTANIEKAFNLLFSRFVASTLVISYRDDGFPSVKKLTEILKNTHQHVQVMDLANYKYALSTQKKSTKEIVIVAKPYFKG